jgi:hypothetical protein
MHNNQKPDGQWVPGQENLKKKIKLTEKKQPL